MKRLTALVLALSLVSTSSFALTSGNDVAFQRAMNKTIAGVVDQKAIAMGASSLQRANTISSISSYLSNNATKIAAGTATAGAATIAAITSPSWLTLMVVGTVLSTGLSYALNKYVFNPSTAKIESPDSTSSPGVLPGQAAYWRGTVDGDLIWTSSGHDAAKLTFDSMTRRGECLNYTPDEVVVNFSPEGAALPYMQTVYIKNGSNFCIITTLLQQPPTAIPACSSGQYYSSGSSSCVSSPLLAPTATPKTPEQTYDTMPVADKTTPLTPSEIAPLVDKVWKEAAAQPGYQGVPYSYSNPVSTQDVSDYQSQNPSVRPTVGDLMAPIPNAATSGSGSPLSMSSPTAQTNPGTTTNPTTDPTTNPNVTEVTVDLGPNPNIGEPSLEEIPTGQQILQPLLNLLNPFKTISFAHNATCPTYSLDLFGRSYVMDTHCLMFEEHKTAIRAVMSAIFAIAAVMILLGA